MKWLSRITWLYLLLPFILFCMGWLRLSVALPAVLICVWALYILIKDETNTAAVLDVGKFAPAGVLIAVVLVLFSGVGGMAFQNWDHHWRNAVLHDLIQYDWPVVYSAADTGPVRMLVYYIGFWLPAAWAGKLLGWEFANLFLFLWTSLGVLLTALHLSTKQRTSLLWSVVLLVFFSGADALGTLFLASDYPSLWPPIQHIEIWSGDLQYSSFTTQLFWVFNQAVPAWLCSMLVFDLAEDKPMRADRRILAWALCFFLAPLASIGLLPFLVSALLQSVDLRHPFKQLRLELILISGSIALISFVFFSSNTAAQDRGLVWPQPGLLIMFFLLEGGLVWLLLWPAMRGDPQWWVTGILLLAIPFIQFGSGRDFVMRASIAPLLFLLVMTGRALSQRTIPRLSRFIVLLLLTAGVLTPLYEIDRSLVRTFEYYLDPASRQAAVIPAEPVTHLEQGVAPELEHPGVLSADDIRTLKFMDDKLSKNFIANVRRSLYYQYLSPH